MMDFSPTSPIIPWMGGKRRLADRLLPLFPDHECYVELFCGGAALYFMRGYPAKCEVINDLNGELVNLYRVVQHHLEEFVRQFKWALSSREVFKWQQNAHVEGLTDIQRAARFYYLQQHAFGGRVSGQSFGTATTGAPINLCRIEEQLSAAHLRLSGTYVEHLPWDECFKKYDRSHTFFYADPPYWETEGYGIEFGFEHYENMAELMRTCKGKVMVSINDHPDIRRAFAGHHMEETDIKYSVASVKTNVKESQELIIMNWVPSDMGRLF